MSSGTYTLYSVEKFPSLDAATTVRVNLPTQTAFEEEGLMPPQASDEVFTEIKYDGKSRIGDFKDLLISHRMPINVHGWWNNHWVDSIIKEDEFDGFYSEKEKVLITHVNKDVSLSATRVLNKHKKEEVILKNIEVNFSDIIKSCENLQGAWFSKMQHTNIRSEAAYGHQIQKDPEFLRLLELGDLQNILISIAFNGKTIRTNTSKICSVYFLDDLPESYCLEFLIYLKQYSKVTEIDAA